MNKFVIQPHFRLQEWVADEKGYFAAEGLDYVFNEERYRQRMARCMTKDRRSAPISRSSLAAPPT